MSQERISDQKFNCAIITYILPLRSKVSCLNWEAVSKACTGTLCSIANQDSRKYRCIMVCHEQPDEIPSIPNLSVVTVDFCRPTPNCFDEYKKDKGMKIKEGIREYRKQPTEFYMVVDADDRIHRSLTSYIERQTGLGNMLVDKGYVYQWGRFARIHNGNFYKLCGSTFVSTYDELEIAGIQVLQGHNTIKERFVSEKRPLSLIPFKAVMKMVGYGGNLTKTEFLWSRAFQRTLRKALLMRFVTKKISKAFALNRYPMSI